MKKSLLFLSLFLSTFLISNAQHALESCDNSSKEMGIKFSIVSDNSARFDFAPLIDRAASLERNVGNVIGAGINYNIWLMHIAPLAPAIPLIFGGPFDVNFNGTTTIPQ